MRAALAQRFDSTYEGLKRPLQLPFPVHWPGFDSTYEGLKHGSADIMRIDGRRFRQYL